MAKRSRKRSSRQGREQAGCVPSLIKIFDFRRGRSAKRLLPDRRPSIREAVYHDEVSEINEDFEEKGKPENGKISVKELMEEEFGEITSYSEKKNSVSELEDGAECLAERKTFDKLVYETIVEHLVGISTESSSKNDFISVLNVLSAQAVTVTDQKLVAAVKLLVEQKVWNLRNYEESLSREEFLDALGMLTANYGLFLELLQELNSVRFKQSPSRLPENTKSDGNGAGKHEKKFRRRSRSLESFLHGGNDDCHPSSLAIVKPPGSAMTPSLKNDCASLLSLYIYNKEKNDRSRSLRFSFSGLKRKLWHALLVKEKALISSECSPTNRNRKHNNMGWSSPNRNHFYSENFILSPGRNGEQNFKSKENWYGTSQCQRLGGFNIYIEAKKHISEMLKDGDEDSGSMIKHLPMSLGMILAVPTYSTSPGTSPREFDDEKSLIISRNVADGILEEDVGSLSSTKDEGTDDVRAMSIGMHPDISSGDEKGNTLEESFLIIVDTGKAAESRLGDEEKIITAVCESCSSSTDGDMQHGGTSENSHQLIESSTGLKSDFAGEDQTCSSPAASGEAFNTATDKSEQPSPVSVLDPLLYMDDAISSASILSEPAREVQPRHLNFEEGFSPCDQGICRRISMEDEESPFEYVEAVLLGSGLDWDDFYFRWLSSDEILDSSLFDEVELFSNRSRHDQHLLFDSANEALTGACDIYFGKKGNFRAIPSSVDVIDQIWRWVEWHLVRHTQANSMDRLVRMDLARTGNWMNFERDFGIIGFEIEVTIFDVLMDDTILSFQEAFSETAFDEDEALFGTQSEVA